MVGVGGKSRFFCFFVPGKVGVFGFFGPRKVSTLSGTSGYYGDGRIYKDIGINCYKSSIPF